MALNELKRRINEAFEMLELIKVSLNDTYDISAESFTELSDAELYQIKRDILGISDFLRTSDIIEDYALYGDIEDEFSKRRRASLNKANELKKAEFDAKNSAYSKAVRNMAINTEQELLARLPFFAVNLDAERRGKSMIISNFHVRNHKESDFEFKTIQDFLNDKSYLKTLTGSKLMEYAIFSALLSYKKDKSEGDTNKIVVANLPLRTYLKEDFKNLNPAKNYLAIEFDGERTWADDEKYEEILHNLRKNGEIEQMQAFRDECGTERQMFSVTIKYSNGGDLLEYFKTNRTVPYYTVDWACPYCYYDGLEETYINRKKEEFKQLLIIEI